MHGPHCEGMLANPLPSQHGVRELCLLGCSHEEGEEAGEKEELHFARDTADLEIDDVADEKGVRWEETPPFFRYGTFVKKEQYDKEVERLNK